MDSMKDFNDNSLYDTSLAKKGGIMETYATTVYVSSEEILRILGIKDDPQSQMPNAEVITFAILSAKYFSCNYKMSRYLCKRLRLFRAILNNSRLNRRIHKIPWTLIAT